MQTDERIDALEKRIAALETLVQAQQTVTVSPEEMITAAMMELNRKTRESGTPTLLC